MSGHVWSPEECMTKVNGVCSGCGGPLSPIETVDNADRPTHWPGCLTCHKFDYGTPRIVFDVASKLFDEGERPYSHMDNPNPDDEGEVLYYRRAQVAGLCRTVWRVLGLHAELTKGPQP